MDKYIGNKKVIVDGIEEFLKSKDITQGLFIDVFSGTTNVAQYFKQRGYSIACNDINHFSYVLGKTYIQNNTFPEFSKLLNSKYFDKFVDNPDETDGGIKYIKKKIESDKLYDSNYFQQTKYEHNIKPLQMVLQYLNNVDLTELTECELLFYNYYTVSGKNASYKSVRGTEGKRNYFSTDNAKRLGKAMSLIKEWNNSKLISDMELYILLTCVIEEVTLNANVNGTFHDFNRSKLYPNAEVRLFFRPIMLNIYPEQKEYYVFKEDANLLYSNPKFATIDISESILYIDPPYNFRQYSSYYHMLNFIAEYCYLSDVLAYASEFEFVRGQNMKDNFNSKYCYKEKFIDALKDLVESVKSRYILISYYDENNHWNHGKEKISFEGREAIGGIFRQLDDIIYFDDEPSSIERRNYQSRSGAKKKIIEELLFYARR